MRTFAMLSLGWFAAACGRTTLDHVSVVDSGRDTATVADAVRIAVADSAAGPHDSGSGQWTFAPQVSYPAAWSPWSLAVGDFNGDGVPDVAATSVDETYNSVAVWLNNGDGTFAPPVTYALTSSSPYANSWTVAAGDFNGDHKLDFAVVGDTDSTGGILFGRGDGSFAPEVPFAISSAGAEGIAVDDLDGNGKPDLVVATGGQSVGVLLNPGDGSFSQESTYAAGGGAWTLALADFNGDGHLDLAVAASPNGVSVLTNQGDGTFTPPVTFALRSTNQVNVLVAGDFNDDGHPDLACTFFQSHGVAMWLNRGDGSFAPEVDYSTGYWPTGIAVADFDGDGRTDLAVANSFVYDSGVSVLLNAGGGTFPTQVTYATGSCPNDIATADFNRDDHPDLAVANTGDQTLGILLSVCR